MNCCVLPPKGWACTREPGHDGPCAAWPWPPHKPNRFLRIFLLAIISFLLLLVVYQGQVIASQRATILQMFEDTCPAPPQLQEF